MKTVLTLFGTRPEVIKLAPVIRALEAGGRFRTVNVASGQHTDLVAPFIRLFEIRVDHDLRLMQPGQTPNLLLARALTALDPVITEERPDLLLVQGDTTTALAGALAGFHSRIPVGHVEAGLRSGDVTSPFPEEINRRLITRLSSYHFAATPQNVDTLLAEGVCAGHIFLTGNPVVASLREILKETSPSPALERVLKATQGLRRVVLTTHRRENFGAVMGAHLEVLRRLVEAHEDVALVFPVHPNPAVRRAAQVLAGHPRICLLEPMDYPGFIGLLARAWLIVSDSGGVQEEAPTLGKPLLILRETTERPEAVACGIARLVGHDPARLRELLEQEYRERPRDDGRLPVENPFGHGDSGERIARAITQVLQAGNR